MRSDVVIPVILVLLSSATGYYPPREIQVSRHEKQDAGKERLLNVPSIDSSLVYSGVLQPENIIIHVTQNFLNFASSSALWFVLLYLYQAPTNGKRRRRSSDNSMFREEAHNEWTWEDVRDLDEDEEDVDDEDEHHQDRSRRSLADESQGSPFGVDLDNVAWVLRQLADTAEQYKRMQDEL